MNVIDTVRADQLDGGEHILVIRQIKRDIVRIPLESVQVKDLTACIEVEGFNFDTGDKSVFFLYPDEEVEIWEA